MKLWLKGIGILMIVMTIIASITGIAIAYVVFIKAIQEHNAIVDQSYMESLKNPLYNSTMLYDVIRQRQDSRHGVKMFLGCVGGILLFSTFNIGSGLMFIGVSNLLKASELKQRNFNNVSTSEVVT